MRREQALLSENSNALALVTGYIQKHEAPRKRNGNVRSPAGTINGIRMGQYSLVNEKTIYPPGVGK
jgi:hypothetical protein